MPDIIEEAWRSVSDCTLLAQEATDAKARQFFLNLARSWKKIALNYEVLARNDRYLIELKRAREADSAARPAEGLRNRPDPVRPEITARLATGLFWRRA